MVESDPRGYACGWLVGQTDIQVETSEYPSTGHLRRVSSEDR